MEPRLGHAFAPSARDFVPAGHLAHFIRDLVAQELDLSVIFGGYAEEKGYPLHQQGLYRTRGFHGGDCLESTRLPHRE